VATVTLLICLPTVVSLIPVIKGFFNKNNRTPGYEPGASGTKLYGKKLIIGRFIFLIDSHDEIYALLVAAESIKNECLNLYRKFGQPFNNQ
jgi:hypothetical protein